MYLQPISAAHIPWSSGALGELATGEGQQVALQTVSSAGTIAAGTAPLWTQAAWAIPVIGGAVAGVALALTAWFSRKGPKQKVATTQIVEKLANAQGTGIMQENLRAYMGGPHTVSSQAQALANFDAAWQWLLENCGAPEMGDPGEHCISERQRGGIYDMFKDNRDPIANDPNVVPDPTLFSGVEQAGQGILSSITGGGGGLLLLGAAALLLFAAGSGGKS